MLQPNADQLHHPNNTPTTGAAGERHQPTGVHRQVPHAAGERAQGNAGPLLVRDLQRARGHGTERVDDRPRPPRPPSRRRSTGWRPRSTPPIRARCVTNGVADVRLLFERHQRQEQLVLGQRAARRGRQAERDARLLRGPLLRRQRIAGLGHGAVAVRTPGDVLGPRQEAGDRRVLRARRPTAFRRTTSTRTSTTAATTAPGPGNTTTAATRPGNADQVAVDADRDPERLQRAHGRSERLPLTAVSP